MQVRRLVRIGCEGGNCPTTYATDRGTVLVQGDAVRGDVDAVAVPPELLDLHRTAAPHRPLADAAAGPEGRVILRGRRIWDAHVLSTIALPAHENLVEIDR